MKTRMPDVRGTAGLLLLTTAADFLIRPFAQSAALTAQQGITAAAVNTALVCLALWPLCRWRLHTLKGRPYLTAALFLLFAFAGGEALVRTESFLRYVSDDPLPHLTVYVLALAVTLYAVRSGPEAVARACGVLLWALGASLVLLIAANARGMRLENLQLASVSLGEIVKNAAAGFVLPAQIPLFFFLTQKEDRQKGSRVATTLWLLYGLYVLLAVCAELVLGGQAQAQSQLPHTLARLGSISVFKRLDTLHLAIWLPAELLKICAFAIGLRGLVETVCPRLLRAHASLWALAAIAAGTLCVGMVRHEQFLWAQTAVSAAVLAAMGWKHEKTA